MAFLQNQENYDKIHDFKSIKIRNIDGGIFLDAILKKNQEIEPREFNIIEYQQNGPMIRPDCYGKRLRYNITSLVPLSELLKYPIGWKKFFSMCFNIFCIIKNIQSLYIQYNKLILDTRYIFMDLNNMSIYVVYAPVLGYRQHNDLLLFFKYFLYSAVPMSVKDKEKFSEMGSILDGMVALSQYEFENYLISQINSDGNIIQRFEGTKGRQPTLILRNYNSSIVFHIDIPEYILGRNCNAVNGYIAGDMSVGRQHCKISFRNGKYFICDLNSKNGTYVNGKRILSGKKVPLNYGDVVKLSNAEFYTEIKST